MQRGTVGPFRNLLLAGVVLAATIGADQATKALARQSLASRPPVSFFGGIFQFLYAENPGAFLSFGAGLSEATRFWIFTIAVGGFLAGMFFYICFSRRLTRPEVLALSLILGGGAGNLIDRLLHDHRVIDFMVVGVGRLRTGIFNVADVAITAGVGLLFWLSIGSPHRQEFQTRSRHD